MEIIYFENQHLTLYYDKAKSTVRAVWEGFLSGEELKAPVRHCLKLIDDERPRNWLADNRKLKAIRRQDQEWLEKNMIPHLATSSLRKLATLIAEDIFGQMAIDSIYSKSTNLINFEHQYFKSEEAAKAWLTQDISQNRTMNIA